MTGDCRPAVIEFSSVSGADAGVGPEVGGNDFLQSLWGCKAYGDAKVEGHPAPVISKSPLSRDPDLVELGLFQSLACEPDETREWATMALAPYQTMAMALATMATATPTANLSVISEDPGIESLVEEHLDPQGLIHDAAPKEVRCLGEELVNQSTSCESLGSKYLSDGEFQVYQSTSCESLGSKFLSDGEFQVYQSTSCESLGSTGAWHGLDDELVSQSLSCEPLNSPFEPQLDPHQLIIRNIDTGEYSRCEPVAESSSCEPLNSQNRPQCWAKWWADKRLKDEHLWAAAETGSLEDLQEALAAPSDGSPHAAINSLALYGRRALHIAASVGNTDCAEVLLDAGAEIEARTDAGLTALHVACQRGHLGIALLLLDRGARMLAETCDCNLPIHLAAAKGHSDIVALLLERSGGKLLRTAVRELLLMKNSLGQRPSEVSLDRKTAELFWQLESEMSDRVSQVVDRYAGRRPSGLGGDVLRRNARADMVHRLLQKTGSSPRMCDTEHSDNDANAESPKEDNLESSKMLASQSCAQVRGPFARIRADSAEIEEVGPDAFCFIQKLGSGSFGEVYQVKHKKTNLVYAMKIIHKGKIHGKAMMRCTLTERNVLTYMHHPYIVALHYAFQTPLYFVLVMQYYPGGNLQHLIDKDGKLTQDLARLYTAEMLLAVSHLHDRHIVYRDLKPANVVIDEFGHSALTDFGLSKEGVSHLRGTQSFCGSSAYMAPEILQRRGQGHTVDIYGLGVLLFNMLTGLPPFWHPDKKVLFNNITQARLHMPEFITQPAASLIKALVKRDPSKRLGANRTLDVQEHEFFADIDFDELMSREVCVPAQAATSGAPSVWPAKEKCLFNWNKGKRAGVSGDVPGWAFAAPRERSTSRQCSPTGQATKVLA